MNFLSHEELPRRNGKLRAGALSKPLPLGRHRQLVGRFVSAFELEQNVMRKALSQASKSRVARFRFLLMLGMELTNFQFPLSQL